MASTRPLLPLAFLLLTAGCDTPGDDFPNDGETISIGRAALGEPVTVSIGQSTYEWEFCHPRMGEFGPWIDCSEHRKRAAHLVSIECTPADACRDVTIEAAKGSFVPLAPELRVKVVGDLEGKRVERSLLVEIDLRSIGVNFSREHGFSEADFTLCPFANAPALSVSVTLNGAPIEAAKDSTRPECSIVRPGVAGTLRAVPRLVDPEVELAAVTATVHPLSEAEDVEIRDLLCFGDREIGAYVDQYGSYLVSVSASAMVRTSPTSRESAPLPGARMRVVLGDDEIVEPHGQTTSAAAFMLDAAPPPGSRVEIDLDGRIVAVPLRAKQCD